MKKSTLVIGVIGADCHAVGNKVLDRVFTAHDFHRNQPRGDGEPG